MIATNTCKNVDAVEVALKTACIAWENGCLNPLDIEELFNSLKGVTLAVLGLGCMRAQRLFEEEVWGMFFDALWTAREGRA